MFNMTYVGRVDRVRLDAALEPHEPDEIVKSAWSLRGHPYQDEPQTAAEFAERVALLIWILYNDGHDDQLPDEITGRARTLLPDLEFDTGR